MAGKKTIDSFVKQPAEWLKATGPLNDVVVSSRLRLARNIHGFPFLLKLNESQRHEIVQLVGDAAASGGSLKKALYLNFRDLVELDLEFLTERHLISREHAMEREGRAVALTPDETVSVMVLEEDHLRLQTFRSGLDLSGAWQQASEIDNELEKVLTFAFSPNLGYLTACPTNVGTGLRASCMLHLPGLVLTKQVHKVLQALAKLNLAARGLYGEGTQATGNLFQFSNQMTLGQKEEEIIDNLERVIKQVVDHEREARSFLSQNKSLKFKDQIWRALGTLKSARIISSSEATQHLSILQLGFHMRIFDADVTQADLNGLFLMTQPAHLQKWKGKELSANERDEARASLIRQKLKKFKL